MKYIKDILLNVSYTTKGADLPSYVLDISINSKKVQQNGMFIAISGYKVDGHNYIDQAINQGARVVVCEKLPSFSDNSSHTSYVQVDNSKESLGIIASNYYNHPSKKLKIVGITGTNGKTTTVTLLYKVFISLGYRVGLLSSIENKINNQRFPSNLTTPDAITLNSLLAKMVEQNCTHCFMEVSSHALVQHRTTGINFDGAVFTNISHDHLDYHETVDEYIKAKKMLFDGLHSTSFALVNSDDKKGKIMLQNTKAKQWTYGLHSMSDFSAKIINNSIDGLELNIEGVDVWIQMIGKFNTYNFLAAYAVAKLLGEESLSILTSLSQIKGVKGRFNKIKNDANILAIVDYAHSPDALKNTLKAISDVRTNNEKLITVIGCGGNRDVSKRSKMGHISTIYSDKVILTTDNPRDEDPHTILSHMKQGITKSEEKKVLTIQDRYEAIHTACEIANKKDIILVTGKGHETYQEIKGKRYEFDDKKILKKHLNALH